MASCDIALPPAHAQPSRPSPPHPAAKFTKRGLIGLRVRVVRRGYRPDPREAAEFCEGHSGGHGAEGEGAPSPFALSLEATDTDSSEGAPTPLAAAAAGAAAFAAPAAETGSPVHYPSKHHNRRLGHARAVGHGHAQRHMGHHHPTSEHDSAQSLGMADACPRPPARMSTVVHGRDGWNSVISRSSHGRPSDDGGSSSDPASSSSSSSGYSGSDEEAEGLMLAFEVMDTGAGVAPKSLDKLFKEYSQVRCGGGCCAAGGCTVVEGAVQGVAGVSAAG